MEMRVGKKNEKLLLALAIEIIVVVTVLMMVG